MTTSILVSEFRDSRSSLQRDIQRGKSFVLKHYRQDLAKVLPYEQADGLVPDDAEYMTLQESQRESGLMTQYLQQGIVVVITKGRSRTPFMALIPI